MCTRENKFCFVNITTVLIKSLILRVIHIQNIRMKLNYLPDEAVFKMAAQIQTMLKEEEYENIIFEF